MSPFARYDRLDVEKRRRIMDAATAEFVEKGYEDASMNQIIAAAGISKGSFYYYFEDKADLFVTVLREHVVLEEYMDLARLDDATCHEEFWRFTSEMSREAMRRVEESPVIVRLGKIAATLSPSVREHHAVQAFYAEASGYVVRLIASGQRARAIRDDLPMPVLIKLWMSVDAVLSEWGSQTWETDPPERRDEVIGVTLDAFKRLFSPLEVDP